MEIVIYNSVNNPAILKRIKKSYFRIRLRDKAFEWYKKLFGSIKEWDIISIAFIIRFKKRYSDKDFGLKTQINAFGY